MKKFNKYSKRRSTRRYRKRIETVAKPYNVSPRSLFSPIPNQMRVRLRLEYDSLLNIAAQAYTLGFQSTMNMRGLDIGPNVPAGTAFTFPPGLKQLHVLYQRSVVEKATVCFNFSNTSQTPVYVSCGVLTTRDTLAAGAALSPVTFNSLRGRSDFRSYIVQTEGGNANVKHIQTIDLRKMYPTLLTGNEFTSFSDRSGQINFPLDNDEIPQFVYMMSPCEAQAAQIPCKVTVEYHVHFYDLHILQAKNNLIWTAN